MTLAALLWPYVERTIEQLVLTLDDLDLEGRTWRPAAPNTNSVASLINHTLANAEENLLQTISGDTVTYDRDAGFDEPELDADAVRARWSRLRAATDARLPSLTDEQMLQPVPHPRRGTMTRIEVLLIVARHASEHLAQAELTRDLYRARTPTPSP